MTRRNNQRRTTGIVWNQGDSWAGKRNASESIQIVAFVRLDALDREVTLQLVEYIKRDRMQHRESCRVRDTSVGRRGVMRVRRLLIHGTVQVASNGRR